MYRRRLYGSRHRRVPTAVRPDSVREAHASALDVANAEGTHDPTAHVEAPSFVLKQASPYARPPAGSVAGYLEPWKWDAPLEMTAE